MKKFLVIFFGFFIGVILFMPKERLFFTLQKYLAQKQIFINGASKETPLSLQLTNTTLFYNGMDVASMRRISIYPYLFFNRLQMHDAALKVGNYSIKTLSADYSLLHPWQVVLHGKSTSGSLDGAIDLKARELKLYIQNPPHILLQYLQKNKKGYYFYEKF